MKTRELRLVPAVGWEDAANEIRILLEAGDSASTRGWLAWPAVGRSFRLWTSKIRGSAIVEASTHINTSSDSDWSLYKVNETGILRISSARATNLYYHKQGKAAALISSVPFEKGGCKKQTNKKDP